MNTIELLLIITFVIFLYIAYTFPARKFFKDMPKGIFKKGKYKPYAFRSWIMTDSKLYYSKRIYRRLISAYMSARFIAWKLDITSLGEECGICWGIENLKEGD